MQGKYISLVYVFSYEIVRKKTFVILVFKIIYVISMAWKDLPQSIVLCTSYKYCEVILFLSTDSNYIQKITLIVSHMCNII